MTGKIPGVEAARRRRLHQRGCGAGAWSEFNPGGGCSRRPVFCLYVSSFDPNPFSPCPSVVQRSEKNRPCEDEMLGKVAREAKERLDERLRAKRTSHIARKKSDAGEERPTEEARATEEVFGCAKSRVMRWAIKLGGWKASAQPECAVCLEGFKLGDKLVSLPCAHRFHSSCLVPWLQHNAHCPYCRMPILP